MPEFEGAQRVVIEGVEPELDAGRFAIKRVVDESVVVEADIFADGHDALTALLRYRHESEAEWTEIEMEPLANDRWRAEFVVGLIGTHRYTLKAWVDPFRTWRRDLFKKLQAGQDVAVDLEVGRGMIRAAIGRVPAAVAERLRPWLAELESGSRSQAEAAELAMDPELGGLMIRHADRSRATDYGRELAVTVDRKLARFSAWYELFPRSTAPEPGRHGTFRDLVRRLPAIAAMGFDVLYLPPIHPIGHTHRKGRNNAVAVGPGEPGSPWAIGSEEGGHKAIHPELGTLEDFHELLSQAWGHGLEIALDIAFQCSPDHPYVREHPEWFRHRPDGSIQYAENPPKKYEDIVPFDFECADWRGLWDELCGVFFYWIEQGVHIFRVDNPHTKPFGFWEWAIGEVKRAHPDAIFLSEAFTRPKVMYRLAKAGFTLSYTYFAWRNTKTELERYLTELTRSKVREFFNPHLWPNTPDILTEYLQTGGRAAFVARLVLAATLGAGYGLYGPAFELAEPRARMWGSEEYLDSEKYELRHWDLARPDSLAPLIARVNQIRRENLALQTNESLRFHPTDNEQLLCYSKHDATGTSVILVVVNLDPHHAQSGWVTLETEDLGVDPARPYQVHDLLTDARYLWQGTRNYVLLDPRVTPASIFRLRRRLRSERDFEYFL